MEPPLYEVVKRSGPDHAPVFTIRAEMKAGTAEATGPSKKEAEREAAARLLKNVEGAE